MGNFIAENVGGLKRRHYLLLANQADYWFNAHPNVLKRYRAKYGKAFCIVLWRDGPEDDAYVLPYSRIEPLLTDANLVPGKRGILRWHGTIQDGKLALRGADGSISVLDCYNAFHLLQQ